MKNKLLLLLVSLGIIYSLNGDQKHFNLLKRYIKMGKTYTDRDLTLKWKDGLLTTEEARDLKQYQENLAKFEPGTWRLCDVVTGDESWFYHKQISRKSSNAAWIASGNLPPTLVILLNLDKLSITNITSIIVCSQLLTKSRKNNLPLVLMELNFTMIMGDHIFIKMY